MEQETHPGQLLGQVHAPVHTPQLAVTVIAVTDDARMWPHDPDQGVWMNSAWTAAVWAAFNEPVVSKANHRMFTKTSGSSSWQKIAMFEQGVHHRLRQVRPPQWVLPASDSAPASRPAVACVVVARTMLDAGNVTKSLLDASEGVLVVNDYEVSALATITERGRANAGAVAAFAQLHVGVTARHKQRALDVLTENVLTLLDQAPAS